MIDLPHSVTFCSPPILVSGQPHERTHMNFELGAYGGDMLSKECLGTARTLLRVARNMTNRTIADRLRALAEDYERQAEKASLADAASALALLVARADREGNSPK